MNDRDELSWEWWSSYGYREGILEDHPNNWGLTISSSEFQPRHVRYRGDISTDADKGNTTERGEFNYLLSYKQPRRLEKYLVGLNQWRPDGVRWYATSASDYPIADVVALYTHSVRNWRNPNVLPLTTGITLRTGANDMRIISYAKDHTLAIQCPIRLGRRSWAIRCSTVAETYAGEGALTPEVVKRELGLDIVRHWVTEWPIGNGYPHLFIKPDHKEAYFARLKGKGTGCSDALDAFLRDQTKESAEQLYRDAIHLADEMINGYFAGGMDTNMYPGWMLGYWHAIIVASQMDNLLGSPYATPEITRTLRKKLAILTYCLTSKDAWPDKQINYGWGSMNMPVGRWGGLAVLV